MSKISEAQNKAQDAEESAQAANNGTKTEVKEEKRDDRLTPRAVLPGEKYHE